MYPEAVVQLTATVTSDEIVRLVRELTPLRIDLGRTRSVSFGTPQVVELVEGVGLRVRGNARMIWEIAGLPLPVSLRAWQLLLAPSVQIRGETLVLVFEPVIEALDFKRVPGFFDERIVFAINEGVASQRGKLAWNVSRGLSWRLPLPKRVVPSRTLDVAPTSASVTVTATELRIDVAFDAHVAGDVAPASLRSA